MMPVMARPSPGDRDRELAGLLYQSTTIYSDSRGWISIGSGDRDRWVRAPRRQVTLDTPDEPAIITGRRRQAHHMRLPVQTVNTLGFADVLPAWAADSASPSPPISIFTSSHGRLDINKRMENTEW
jgi:hypothetical protein